MALTRSRKRGTGDDSKGNARTTRITRNSANADNEPSALPQAKRQRINATTAANSRKTRALKPVATNANSNANANSNNANNSKPTKGRPKAKKLTVKQRGRKAAQEEKESQSNAIEESKPQQVPLSSTGATHAGADDAIHNEESSSVAVKKSASNASIEVIPTSENRNYQDGEPYDIDARDAHDPLSVTDYVEDMYKHFLRKEKQSSVNRMYMGRHGEKDKQPNINESMRCILVDWLIEVHYKFKLFPETLYLTINILDRFLSDTLNPITKRDLQLVGVTSLLIAAKYEEMYVPELRDLTYICDGAYTEAKILRMEEQILKTLEYNVTVPTPHTFLVRYLKAAKADKVMAQLASFLLDGTLLSLEKFTCRWRPSQMAAAAILLARRQVGRHNWSPTLVAYSSYREEHILPVARSLLEQKHRLEQNRELMALAKKYSKTKYGKVSHIAFLPLDESSSQWESSGDDSMDDSEL